MPQNRCAKCVHTVRRCRACRAERNRVDRARRTAHAAQGQCCVCSAPVKLRADGKPSTRCERHARVNTAQSGASHARRRVRVSQRAREPQRGAA